MKKKIILLISIALLISCSQQENTSNPKHSQKGSNTCNIELVNNEKWRVNKDMMLHIKNIELAVNQFSSADYIQLGKELDKHLNLLTSNCTMTGKAHDEMHKWLLPFIDLVEDLNEAITDEERKKSFQEITASLNEFNLYFI